MLFAIVSDWVDSCCLTCKEARRALSAGRLASTSAPKPSVKASWIPVLNLTWLAIAWLSEPTVLSEVAIRLSSVRKVLSRKLPAEVTGHDIEFRQLEVYDVARLAERFDLVLFLGVLYHLRHPLLALDLIHDHVAGDLMVFQSMQRGSRDLEPIETDYDFWETAQFERPGYPKLHFIEHRYADKSAYLATARRGADSLAHAGFLLREDIPRVLERAEQHWNWIMRR